jgi:hypothetical protein
MGADSIQGADMVGMAVSNNDFLYLEIVFFDMVNDTIGIPGGIDYYPLFGLGKEGSIIIPSLVWASPTI